MKEARKNRVRVDQQLRENIEWLLRAENEFSNLSSLYIGAIRSGLATQDTIEAQRHKARLELTRARINVTLLLQCIRP